MFHVFSTFFHGKDTCPQLVNTTVFHRFSAVIQLYFPTIVNNCCMSIFLYIYAEF